MALPFLNQDQQLKVSNGTNTVMEAEPDHIITAQKMGIEINLNENPLQRMAMLRVIKEYITDQLSAESEYEKNRLNEATMMLQRIQGCLTELNQ